MPEIKNPNQQGGGPDSKMLLFYAVMFLAIFLGLQFFHTKNAPKAPNSGQHAPAATSAVGNGQNTAPGVVSTAGQPSDSSAAAASSAKSNAKSSATAAVAVPAGPVVVAANETTTVVESPLYRVTFSNKGGVVTSWVLKKYTNDAQTKPLDLVNQNAAKQFGYPLSLYSYDKQLTPKLNSVLYKPSATGTIEAPATISFEYSSGGLTVRKSFHFEKDYVLTTDISVMQNGHPVTALLAWPSGFGDQETIPQYAGSQIDKEIGAKTGFHLFGGPDVDHIEPKKVSSGNTIQGPLDYAGVSDLYFASIFLPSNPDNALLVTLHNAMDITAKGDKSSSAKKHMAPVLGAAVGSTNGVIHDRLFVGPKAPDVLKAIHTTDNYNLEGVVKYGWWGWIAKPMLWLLTLIYHHVVHSWGWAILLLTVIFYSGMIPTRVTMMKKSVAMMRLQPQMDTIKAKYAKYKATDPRKQEMNQELMALQKKEGVNMFAGCLPMVLQYPLLIGFYEMLEVTITMRHAHWLWLPDLSAPDPYHILPAFVIVSMFLVQYFTPSPGVDPKQQRMMAFLMPVFFGFIMWNLGAGVSLYYAGGNVISMIQQWVMNQSSMGREMKELAARRAAKKAGKVIAGRR